jgi:hypothetical protein
MSDPKTSTAIASVTSSPGSADGPAPCDSPDGPTTDLFGQALAPVSRSVRRGSGRGSATSGTFGPSSTASSATARLQSSLANRLLLRTDVCGSMEYVLTWKDWDMRSGPPICALRAQARPISDNACGGWPTPMAGNPGSDSYNEAGNTDSSRRTVWLCGWPTPNVPNRGCESRESKDKRGSGGLDLQTTARLVVGWPTPNAMEGGATSMSGDRKGELLMGGLVRGLTSTSSNAETEKPGALKPEHSRWLMGYPPEWDACGVTAMPSSRKSRPSSSRRTAKP